MKRCSEQAAVERQHLPSTYPARDELKGIIMMTARTALVTFNFTLISPKPH